MSNVIRRGLRTECKSYFSLFTLHFSLFIAIVLASCSQRRQEVMPSGADSTATDTTVLRVAVMPTMGCLPLYYATRSGLADSLGLEIELLRFQAQMDIDTAILRGHADIAYTDLIRTERLAKDVSLKPFAAADEKLSLVSLKTKRVKRIDQMKEQMIAISRLSATDYWCDHLLDSTHLGHDDIYRPQVNDVWLRAEMLRQGLIDAAMMGEPFATWMTQLGHKRLFSTQKGHARLYAWAATDNVADSVQRAFRHMLDSATVLCGQGDQARLLRDILADEYRLPRELADTLRLPAPAVTSDIRPADVKEAQEWLKKRAGEKNKTEKGKRKKGRSK